MNRKGSCVNIHKEIQCVVVAIAKKKVLSTVSNFNFPFFPTFPFYFQFPLLSYSHSHGHDNGQLKFEVNIDFSAWYEYYYEPLLLTGFHIHTFRSHIVVSFTYIYSQSGIHATSIPSTQREKALLVDSHWNRGTSLEKKLMEIVIVSRNVHKNTLYLNLFILYGGVNGDQTTSI